MGTSASGRAASASVRSPVEIFRSIQPLLQNLPCSSLGTYSIAGLPVNLHFGTEGLRQEVSPALQHLFRKSGHSSQAALSIFVHELTSALFDDSVFRACQSF